jgi:hypothetical protein
MIQCHGDLSPVPLYIHKEIKMRGKPAYIAQGATHTCRKFDNIVDWLKEREEKYGAFGEYEEEEVVHIQAR